MKTAWKGIVHGKLIELDEGGPRSVAGVSSPTPGALTVASLSGPYLVAFI